MAFIDIHAGNQKYLVKSDASEQHLKEVAALVESKIAGFLKEPAMTVSKAAILCAVEVASEMLKGRHQIENYKDTVLEKAGQILDRIDKELSPSTNS